VNDKQKKAMTHYAEIAGRAEFERNRAIQIIINMQDYLRANGRNFVAAEEFIAEARANGWVRESLGEIPQ